MGRKILLVLIVLGVAFGPGCKSSTGPDESGLKGTWAATKAEFTSVADSATKADVVALGGTATLVLNESTAVLTITKSGESARVLSGNWSVSTDVLTFTWTSGAGGQSQFDFILNGDHLTLERGHIGYDFTSGNFEEAILTLELTRQ